MKAPFVHASSPPNLGGRRRILFVLPTIASSAGSATWPGTGDATGWNVCGSLAFGSGDKTSDLAGGLTKSDAVRAVRPISCSLFTGAGVVDSSIYCTPCLLMISCWFPWGTIKSSDNVGVSRDGEESVSSSSRCGGMEWTSPSAWIAKRWHFIRKRWLRRVRRRESSTRIVYWSLAPI